MTVSGARKADVKRKGRELDSLDRLIGDLARRLSRLEAEVEVAERSAKRRGEKR